MAQGKRDDDDAIIEARLRNWGRWARGMPVYLRYQTMHWPETSDGWETRDPREPTPIIADAEQLEVALCVLRVLRPKLFKLVLVRYVIRADVIHACDKLRVSPAVYYALLKQAYTFLEGRLSH